MTRIVYLISLLLFVSNFAMAKSGKESALAYFRDASFWFDIPADWLPDHQKAKEIGVPLALYPKGSTWDSAPSIMYINSISKMKDMGLNQVIENDLKKFKAASNTFKVRSSASLKTRDGKEAIIKEMSTGRPQQPFETIAYVNEEKSVSVIVLSSFSENELERTRLTFEKIVKSYSFLTNKVKIKH